MDTLGVALLGFGHREPDRARTFVRRGALLTVSNHDPRPHVVERVARVHPGQ